MILRNIDFIGKGNQLVTGKKFCVSWIFSLSPFFSSLSSFFFLFFFRFFLFPRFLFWFPSLSFLISLTCGLYFNSFPPPPVGGGGKWQNLLHYLRLRTTPLSSRQFTHINMSHKPCLFTLHPNKMGAAKMNWLMCESVTWLLGPI